MRSPLLRLLKDADPQCGLLLSAIPAKLLDSDTLTVLAGDGLIEFGTRQIEAAYSAGELIEVERVYWSSWTGRGYKPVEEVLREVRREEYYVRLTPKGRLEASRSSTPRKRRKPAQRKLTPTQAETIQVVAECKENYAKAAKRLGKDRKTVKEAYLTALAKLGKEPVKYGKAQSQTFMRDKRGQDDVADIDDQRRDSDENQKRRFRKR